MRALPSWANWAVRLPLWAIVAGLLALILLSNWRSSIWDAKTAAAVDAARTFVAGTKPFHGRLAALEQAQADALHGAATATAGFGRQVKRADSLELAARTAQDRALIAARTAQDTITAFRGLVAGLTNVNAALRLGADSALNAIDSLGKALAYANAAKDAAVRRADSATAVIHGLLKVTECRMLWVLPCIKNVSVGPSLDVVRADARGVHIGPNQIAISVQYHL